ncbi:MAG: FkbM family methyltransferase [Candidatus Scalindua sp.]
MESNCTSNSCIDDSEATMGITILGKERKFFYPNNVKNVIMAVFNGHDYPIINLPSYSTKTIVDVGANVGAAAIYFHSCFPDSEIFCYEPSLKNYRYLQKNTKDFNNIKTFQYGLYNETKQCQLFYGKDFSAQDSIMMSYETRGESEIVNLVKASEEITNKGIREISILKIDTEGCEIPVLEELLILENTDIGIIYAEYHSEEDRLALDRILSPDFTLFYSSAKLIHRGTNGYISKDLCKMHPGIECLKK